MGIHLSGLRDVRSGTLFTMITGIIVKFGEGVQSLYALSLILKLGSTQIHFRSTETILIPMLCSALQITYPATATEQHVAQLSSHFRYFKQMRRKNFPPLTRRPLNLVFNTLSNYSLAQVPTL